MNMKTRLLLSRPNGRASTILAATVVLLLMTALNNFAAVTLYYDGFQSYPATNFAPNPLTNGPAGGQWYYADPVPPMTVGEHQILNSASSTGSGLNSRVWGSGTNNAKLTNAISLAALPAGTNLYTFHLAFVAAADTLTANRTITFNYAISSSAGSLTFVSGHNLDNSQTFAGLSGSGIATSGTRGKAPDRRFEFVFQSSTVTTADNIIFEITRVTNSAGATLTLLLDDVTLYVENNSGPVVQSVQPALTLQNVRVTFSEPVDPATATNVANYAFAGGALTVQTATLLDSGSVDLFTSVQAPNTGYGLQINGVLGLTGATMSSTQLNFTTPALTSSPVRYDAGTTASQPSGPQDPTSAAAGFWTTVTNAFGGMTFGGVTDDASTGFNAWRVTDQNTLSTSGVISYTIPIDQPSDTFARTNGWRLFARTRLVQSFGSVAGDQVVIYSDPLANLRYGLLFGMNASGNLFATLLGGATYTLTTDPSAATTYHTHIIVYDPAVASASYYFDGQLIVTNFPGQAASGNNGVIFGSGSSTAAGEMNYNLVQLDVVNASKPVVTQPPQNSTNGVGQKVTFTASFTPFVNAYQWLSNGVVIAGATSNSFTTPFITSEYNGFQFVCRALSALGNVDTAAATLTVTTDTTPPSITAATPCLLRDRIAITYSEPVIESFAADAANYVWDNPGVSTVSARLIDPLTVEVRGGPFQAGSNYTVRVSNVRDTSNLAIAPASPATVVFPYLDSIARYDAGDTTNSPAGPADPASPAGGNWTASISVDPDISTSAVTDDQGTGIHAWQIRDASTVTSRFASYNQQVATNLQDNARRFGWVMTIRGRLTENLATAGAHFAFYEDYKLDRLGLSFSVNANNDLVMGVSTNAGYMPFVLTADGSALNSYHTHQLVYDALTTNASYYFDGDLVVAGIPLSSPGTNSFAELAWGARSSAGKGVMNYNLVDFTTVSGPFASAAANGNNVAVQFRGVLEAANQLGTPTVWSAIATNSTAATNVYLAPPDQSSRFFRARSLP